LCISGLSKAKLRLSAKLAANGGLGETRKRLAKTPLKLWQNSLKGNLSVSDCAVPAQCGLGNDLHCFMKNFEAMFDLAAKRAEHKRFGARILKFTRNVTSRA